MSFFKDQKLNVQNGFHITLLHLKHYICPVYLTISRLSLQINTNKYCFKKFTYNFRPFNEITGLIITIRCDYGHVLFKNVL